MKEKSISNKGKIEILIAFAIFVGLAILAAVNDLAINKALHNPSSLYGQFFALLGELPSYLAAPTAGAILFHQRYSSNKALSFFPKLFFALLVFVGWFFAIYAWFWGNFISEDLSYSLVYQIFFSAFLTVALLYLTSFVDKQAMKKLLLFAIFIIIVAAISNIIVQIMKQAWARQRFRTMVDSGDFSGFAPWYKPEFLFPASIRTPAYVAAVKAADSDAFRSFPSGHTVAAAASFAMIILPEMYKNLAKYRSLFWIIPIVYTAVVGVSRIVMGAHYLSDILFGGYIGFTTAAIARFIIVKRLN